MKSHHAVFCRDVAIQGLAVFACFALSAQDAFSYLDPVSTTLVLQAIAGFFAAAIAGVRSFRKRVFTFLKTGKFIDPVQPAKRADKDAGAA